MIIRILPSLSNRQQWISFCRREISYCFVEQPDTLVDFQSSHLIITLLNQRVRNGREAVRYSIGSRHSVEPAWNFIRASRFNLEFMVQALESVDFRGNARDNSIFGAVPDVNIRKFFARDRAVISPSFLGPLDPLSAIPEHWDLHSTCRLLANDQFEDLRSEKQTLETESATAPNAASLLVTIIENPDRWHVRLRNSRLWLLDGRQPTCSLVVSIDTPASVRPALNTTGLPDRPKTAAGTGAVVPHKKTEGIAGLPTSSPSATRTTKAASTTAKSGVL